jgi:hypothetical protein
MNDDHSPLRDSTTWISLFVLVLGSIFAVYILI